MTTLTDERLAHLAECCIEQMAGSPARAMWDELLTACEELLDLRRSIRAVEAHYRALFAALAGGDPERAERIIEAGKLVGR